MNSILPENESCRLPYVIFVGGTSGSGKSTVASALAQRLGYEFHDGDDYHSEASRVKMNAGIPLTDEDRFPWMRKLVSLIHKDDSGNTGSKPKRVVIACSALKRVYRRLLVDDLPTSDSRVVMLRLSAETLAERLNERRDHFFNKSLLNSQLATLELPKNDVDEPHVLVVDGELPVQEIVDNIFKEIKNEINFS